MVLCLRCLFFGNKIKCFVVRIMWFCFCFVLNSWFLFFILLRKGQKHRHCKHQINDIFSVSAVVFTNRFHNILGWV